MWIAKGPTECLHVDFVALSSCDPTAAAAVDEDKERWEAVLGFCIN